MENLCTYIVYFFIYSFLGWVCETIYCSIGGQKFVNRGFLNGPICPIYGFGALFVVLMLREYSDNTIMLFICAMIGTSILEYFSSVGLEKIFHAKWWDYSKKICNINGRICLKNSFLFGVMGVLLTKVIHPIITDLVSLIPIKATYCISIILILWIITELTTTINSLNKLGKKLEGLGQVKTELEKIDVTLEKYDNEELIKIINELRNNDNNIKIKLEEISYKISQIKSKNKIQRRLFNAFPNMKHKKHHEQLQHLKELLKDKTK